jgi:hypothetical protein
MLFNGTGGATFAPNTIPSIETVLTLTGLPTHTTVDINFLLAIIDSWDGTGGSPGGGNDTFTVSVDGVGVIFSKIFAIQSGIGNYSPPPGVQIGGLFNRGFSGFADLAFNMGNDPSFMFAHSASTLTVRFIASGSGWQGWADGDEAWGMDNLQVLIDGDTTAVPEPTTMSLLGASLLTAVARRRRRSKRI